MAVTDTGCGMTKEVLDRAFEPFFTTKPVGQGTGLGLPVVFGLVEEMAGSITLTSQPGEGTTVTILIPCLPEPDYTADALPASPTPPQTPAQRGAQP
jgi:signal transduction histidine kinase